MRLPAVTQMDEVWPDFDGIEGNLLAAARAQYDNAAPFPHLVLDDLFSDVPLARVGAAYDQVAPHHWHVQGGPLQSKRRTKHGVPLPAIAQSYFNMLSSGPFIRFLTTVSGIEHLVPDPALHGGGLHEVRGGGHFQVHVDFQTSPTTGLANRLAVITYLNQDWLESDGGLLELWDRKTNRCATRIVPVFGRTVIMKQFEDSLHGHPAVVQPGKCRRALIAYFYTNGRDARPLSSLLETEYLMRPEMGLAQKAEILLRPLLPPVMTKGLRQLLRPSR